MRPLLLALPLLLAATEGLTIGGERFAQADILDARGLPDVGGGAVIMITFAPSAAERLARIAAKGQPIAVTLDGRALAEPAPLDEAATIQIKGSATLEDAMALAKRISGKDPLPDSLEE